MVFPAQDRFSLSSFLVNVCSFLHASQHKEAFGSPVSTSEIEPNRVCTVQPCRWRGVEGDCDHLRQEQYTLKQKNRKKKACLAIQNNSKDFVQSTKTTVWAPTTPFKHQKRPPPPRPILHTAPDVENFSVFFYGPASCMLACLLACLLACSPLLDCTQGLGTDSRMQANPRGGIVGVVLCHANIDQGQSRRTLS